MLRLPGHNRSVYMHQVALNPELGAYISSCTHKSTHTHTYIMCVCAVWIPEYRGVRSIVMGVGYHMMMCRASAPTEWDLHIL